MRTLKTMRLIGGLIAIGLCSCSPSSGPAGPPPPPEVPETPYRITVLRFGGESDLAEIPVAPMQEGMKLFQFTEGSYYQLETISLEGNLEAAPSRLEEAVRDGSDLIAITHPLVLQTFASQEVGSPLVFGILGDPLVLGVGESLDQHQDGLTGAFNPLPASSLLALLKFYLPEAERIGVAFNGVEPLSVAHKEALLREAEGAELEIIAADISAGDSPAAVIEGLLDQNLDAACLVTGLGASASTLIEQASQAKLPVFGYREDQVRNGALAAEVPKLDRIGLETGRMAYRILSGESTASIPFGQVNDMESVVNLKVAEALGIELPTGALRIARAIDGGPSSSSD